MVEKTRNQVVQQWARGFESHPVRQKIQAPIPRLLIRKHKKVSKINVFKGREHGTEVKKSHTDRHEGR